MKNFYIVLCMLLCTPALTAQDQDSLSIFTLYDDFQNTVIEKDVEGHTSLFISGEAPVYIVKKEPTGPIYNSLLNVNYWADFFSQSFPYELQISEIELVIDGSFAITKAHFDEYINDEMSAYGKDLFGYLKTEEGWKLAFLHNTVVLADDNTDYSVPFELPNTIESVIEDFTTFYNDQEGDLLLDLFLDESNQVMVFDEVLSSDYDPSEYQVAEFAIDLAASLDDYVLNISNIESHVIDDYVASVFCDYTISLEDEVIESGRAYFNLAASLEEGWKLSSFIRNTSGVATGIKKRVMSSLLIYPNPAQGVIYLEDEKGISSCQIIDEQGRIIVNRTFQNEINSTLNISGLTPGIYFLKVALNDGNMDMRKILVY